MVTNVNYYYYVVRHYYLKESFLDATLYKSAPLDKMLND